jgi:hypothetical protein
LVDSPPTSVIIDFPRQAVENSDIQVIPHIINAVWICVIYVWLARTRKSSSTCSCPTQVRHSCALDCPCLTYAYECSLLAAENHAYFRTFLLASCAGVFSLFPLLFTPAGRPFFCATATCFKLTRISCAETFVKIVYSAIWAFFVFNPLNRQVYW